MNSKENGAGTEQQGQEAEAIRRCSAFRITEGGSTEHFRVDGLGGLLKAAQYVHSYQQGKDAFAEAVHGREPISADTFDQMALSRFTSAGQDTEVFDVNCDKGEFSAVRFLSGWVTYKMSDVSAALRHSGYGDMYGWEERQVQLAETLIGKEISSAGHLSTEDISLAEEIVEMDGQRLNFYLEANFNVDAVFGTHVCTADNDDWLNVYANYDIANGQVCNELEISLHHDDGSEEELSYSLSPTEKELLLRKMDAYCQQQTGLSLKDYGAQLMAEEMAPPAGPVM